MTFVMTVVLAAVTTVRARAIRLNGNRSLGLSGFLQVSAQASYNSSLLARGRMQSAYRQGHDGVPMWKEYELDGHTFYVNSVTGIKQWTKPIQLTSGLATFVATDPAVFERHELITSSIKCHTILYRKMDRIVEASDITLAFQGDVERLALLRKVAWFWDGPVSASILLLESEIAEVDRFLGVSPAVKRNVDLNLCVAKERWAYYPVNKMRNHANRHVRSDYIFIVDADEDCVQSMQTFQNDMQQAILSTNANPDATAFIVTSWQWGDRVLPCSEYPHTKADIVKLSAEGKVVCKANDFPIAYSPPNVGLDGWIDSDSALVVPWGDRYEPYMIVHKNVLGIFDDRFVFDERFVGWGGNKAIFSLKMQLQHVRMVLLPHVFTFTNTSMLDDNAKEHEFPANPDLPELAARELGMKFGCNQCTYKECIANCVVGVDALPY